jgi:S-adenosylmethionine synthetase
MSKNYIFSSESVGEGHPDKVCDTISDAVLDACLAQDKFSRVACECYAKSNIVIVGGEITTKAKLDFNQDRPRGHPRNRLRQRRRRVSRRQGVRHERHHAQQSPDIAQGVDARKAKGKKTAKQGAGDQGLMFGYACNETPELMPAPIMFAHRLGRELTRIRKTGKVPWLRPDAKSQVSVVYVNDKPVPSPTSSSPRSTRGREAREIEEFCIENIIKKVLPKRLLTKKTEFLINPTGRFVVGGPQGDTGLTGRKIIVDSYGGMGRHGGGAFSGKDPTKVDRSAAYMGRWVAKNIVAAGSPRNAKSSSPTPSAIPTRSASAWTRSARRPFRRAKSSAPSTACSASSRRTSLTSSTCAADLFQDHQLRPLRQERPGRSRGKRPTRSRR